MFKLTQGAMVAAIFALALVCGTVQAACTTDDSSWSTMDGGCKDLQTNLVWNMDSGMDAAAGNPNGLGYGTTFDASNLRCQNLDEGGKTDWRLPSKAEMQTAAAHSAATHLQYGYGPNNLRWSNTPGTKKDAQKIYAVQIGDGTAVLATKTSQIFSFCVRP